MSKGEKRDRLVSAALRYAAAERGGLDNQDRDEELARAEAILDEAVQRYIQHDDEATGFFTVPDDPVADVGGREVIDWPHGSDDEPYGDGHPI